MSRISGLILRFKTLILNFINFIFISFLVLNNLIFNTSILKMNIFKKGFNWLREKFKNQKKEQIKNSNNNIPSDPLKSDEATPTVKKVKWAEQELPSKKNKKFWWEELNLSSKERFEIYDSTLDPEKMKKLREYHLNKKENFSNEDDTDADDGISEFSLTNFNVLWSLNVFQAYSVISYSKLRFVNLNWISNFKFNFKKHHQGLGLLINFFGSFFSTLVKKIYLIKIVIGWNGNKNPLNPKNWIKNLK